MSTPTLRNMTAIYLLKDDKILLLYRQGSKVSSNKWIGAAGGYNDKLYVGVANGEKVVFTELLEF